MTCWHLPVLTLVLACLLLVPSWSNTNGGTDEEYDADEPKETSEKGIPGKNIERRSIKDKKPKKKYNQNKNKKKQKGKNKKKKDKKPKEKQDTSEHTASCGFNDDELSTNGTNRSPWDQHGTWYGYRYVWDSGKIPYYFKGTVSHRDRAVFRRAMAQVHAKTCFRFNEIYSKPSYHHLEITVGSTTCWPNFFAYVSAANPPASDTTMVLHSTYQLADNSNCNWEGDILHELMHALGVGHTQKRKDRNDFITVHDANIAGAGQYAICDKCTLHPNIPYECNSIMHYGYKTGRIKGNTGRTMTARNPSCCHINAYGPSVATDNDWNLLKIIADKVCKASCTGTSNEWGCCTSSSPCQELQGDCDSNSDCAGSLVCGTNNCKNFYSGAEDLADCCIKPEALSFCANNWDGPLQYQCPSGQGISRMASYHSNHREDRRWHFQCTKASFIPTSCGWSSYTQYDEIIDYQCSGPDGVLVALESHHDNHREDRRWKFKCCSSYCFWSGWINRWDGYMNYHVDTNYYHIAGLYSYHDNGREDRRWKLRLCRNPSNSRSSIIDDAEKERIRNSTMNIDAEDIIRINALFPSRCPQTETCLRAGGTCQKQNEENEQEEGKVKGKGKNKGKGKGKRKPKGKGKRKQQEHGNNLCKDGCKCMITI